MTTCLLQAICGKGVDVNDSLAVAYAKMASEAGDPKRMYKHGLQKLNDRTTDRNLNRARQLTEKAIKKGVPQRKNNPGNLLPSRADR